MSQTRVHRPFRVAMTAALVLALTVPLGEGAFAAPAAPGAVARPDAGIEQVASRKRQPGRRNGGRDAALVGAAALGILGLAIAAGAAQDRRRGPDYYEGGRYRPRPQRAYGAYGDYGGGYAPDGGYYAQPRQRREWRQPAPAPYGYDGGRRMAPQQQRQVVRPAPQQARPVPQQVRPGPQQGWSRGPVYVQPTRPGMQPDASIPALGRGGD